MRRVLHATSQRGRVHFMRNALAHAGKGHRRLVSAWIGTAFAEADAEGREAAVALVEQDDEWGGRRRYMNLETLPPSAILRTPASRRGRLTAALDRSGGPGAPTPRDGTRPTTSPVRFKTGRSITREFGTRSSYGNSGGVGQRRKP